jgi:hypothetical protein
VQFLNKWSILKNTCQKIVDSVVAWALAKHMCSRLLNSTMLLGFNFIPLDQIANMSLNGMRRRVATRDKNLTGAQMEKTSVALDSGTWFHLGGPLLHHYVSHKIICWRILKLGFFSVRHNAISKQVDDFEEHCA